MKTMLLNSSNGIKFPQFYSDRRWMKATERREIRKEGRIGERLAEGRMVET